MQRRTLITASAALAALPALAQPASTPDPLAPNPAALERARADFLRGAQPQAEGLLLDAPALADNPSAVPIKIKVTLAITAQDWCEELIVLAEANPEPLACRLWFGPANGSAEATLRLRLTQSQTITALARMKSGQLLAASQAVTVAASGCGM